MNVMYVYTPLKHSYGNRDSGLSLGKYRTPLTQHTQTCLQTKNIEKNTRREVKKAHGALFGRSRAASRKRTRDYTTKRCTVVKT